MHHRHNHKYLSMYMVCAHLKYAYKLVVCRHKYNGLHPTNLSYSKLLLSYPLNIRSIVGYQGLWTAAHIALQQQAHPRQAVVGDDVVPTSLNEGRGEVVVLALVFMFHLGSAGPEGRSAGCMQPWWYKPKGGRAAQMWKCTKCRKARNRANLGR